MINGELQTHRKYVLFGSGIRAERIMRICRNLNIDYIIDNDNNKWDKNVSICGNDYRVLPPERIKEEKLEKTDIIIASTYRAEMLAQLKNLVSTIPNRLTIKEIELAAEDKKLSVYIASFSDMNSISIHHDYSQIDADRWIIRITDEPCAICFDRICINSMEEKCPPETLKTNGKWDNKNSIHFPNGNPAIYMDKYDGITTLYIENHFVEIDYKIAYEFVRGFHKAMTDFSNDANPEFVAEEDYEPIIFGENDVKPIAYYLPQFHQIPQNDEWWEKGFTEWTNVTKTYPLFEGHYQPHLPIDMGFYDLNNICVQKRQIELAKKYGIYGFCYYYYHFENAKLLDVPLKQHLQNKELDFPFCIFWDNEEWTKRWVGNDTIMMRIGQSDDYYLDVIKGIIEYLKDPRYIRISGKPVIIIYKPQNIVRLGRLLELWRERCMAEGVGEIYLMYVHSDRTKYLKLLDGFNGVNGFLSDWVRFEITHQYAFYSNVENNEIFSYKFCLDKWNYNRTKTGDTFKTAFVGYDNSARYKNKASIYHETTPSLFKEHIKRTISYTKTNLITPSRYMFIFAWNEWAESAHLEPDRKYGYAWLKATREAVLESRDE